MKSSGLTCTDWLARDTEEEPPVPPADWPDTEPEVSVAAPSDGCSTLLALSPFGAWERGKEKEQWVRGPRSDKYEVANVGCFFEKNLAWASFFGEKNDCTAYWNWKTKNKMV